MSGMASLALLSGTVCAGVAGFLATFSGENYFCFELLVCTELGCSFSFFSPNSTSCNNSTAFNYYIGALFGCCLISFSSCLAASRILLYGVSCGMAIALFLDCTVSDIISDPVDGRMPLKVR